MSAVGQAFRPNVTHYGVEDGLSHREVNAVFQDKDGFIWLGTKFGLNRFDGYHFEWYTKDNAGNEFNQINQICQDEEDWLWLFMGRAGSSPDTIILLNPHTNQVKSLAEHFNGNFPVKVNQLNIPTVKSPTGTLFFSLQNQAALIRCQAGGQVNLFPIEAHQEFTALAYSSRKTIWGIADGNTVLEINENGKVLNTYVHHQPIIIADCFLRKDTFCLAQERLGKNGERFFQVVPDQGIRPVRGNAFSGNLLNAANFQRIRYSAHKDLLWMLYDDQLEVVQPGGGVLFELAEEYPDLRSSFIRGWEEDSAGRIWVGGNFGFYIIDVKTNHFSNYLSVDIGQDLFYPNSCRGMIVEEDQLLVTTESNGLHQIDLQSGKSQKIDREEKRKEYLGRALHRINTDSIWIGKNRLVNFNLENSDSTIIPFSRARANDLHIWAIYQDEQQWMWLGTEEGLYLYEPNGTQIQNFQGYGEHTELSRSFILHIGKDKQNNIWVCANTGLYQLNAEAKVLARYWRGAQGAFHLPAEDFQHFYQDDKGIYWLATAGSGLIRWDKEAGTHRIFTRNEGLPHNNIYAVYEGVDQQLWLSSDFGIVRFDKNSYEVNTYLRKDGVSHHEFNRISHLQDAKGRIFFGSLNGLTVFDPLDFSDKGKPSDSRMVITNFQQFVSDANRLVDRRASILQTQRIVMEPGDPFFLLEFALLSYENTEKIRYRYKIDKIDQDWTEQKERSIRLSRLPYGNHVLHINAQAANGEWVQDKLFIDIEVKRPVYLQAWFIGLCALLGMLAIYMYIKWRNYEYIKTQQRLQEEVNRATAQILEDKTTIEAQAEELRQLDKIKSRFFANVSHELRTPLTLMLGPLSSLLKSKNLNAHQNSLLNTARKSGHQLLNLINEILELSRLESGKLEVKEHPTLLLPFIRQIVAAFEAHAKRNEVDFEFDYQVNENLQLNVDTDKLRKIFNNLLSNAFKFTPKGGQVKVVVADLNQHIRLQVVDSGRGIAASDLPHIFNRFYQSKQSDAPTEGGTGIGLALCRELAELLNGRIWVDSDLGKGSTFYFEFPQKEVIGEIDEVDDPEVLVDEESVAPLVVPVDTVKQGAKASIMVVEDNLHLREYLQLILNPYYHVITAENGRVAFDLLDQCYLKSPKGASTNAVLQQNSPAESGKPLEVDLIISDLMMPVMDGYQLASELKGNAVLRQIPLVMLTARADFEDKLKALRIGVDDYMVKPFEEEELFARVANLLRNSHLRKVAQKEAQSEEAIVNENKSLAEPVLAIISDEEQAWLTKLEETVIEQLGNFGLTAEKLASLMGTSRGQLFRKIRKLTGLTFAQYIQEIRLTQARSMLENKDQNSVKAVAYAVGLKHVKNFSQLFKKRFGKSPSNYLTN